MQVQAGIVPGPGLQSVALGNGATVNDALIAAGLSSEGFTITVDGETAHTSHVLREGQRVILTKNAKGNS